MARFPEGHVAMVTGAGSGIGRSFGQCIETGRDPMWRKFWIADGVDKLDIDFLLGRIASAVPQVKASLNDWIQRVE
ncbi:MAG: hypothetical protein GY847_22700 [Proteobacteria bacterium]|nr:hypothetical protein [Pseudomonadota bacterium]